MNFFKLLLLFVILWASLDCAGGDKKKKGSVTSRIKSKVKSSLTKKLTGSKKKDKKIKSSKKSKKKTISKVKKLAKNKKVQKAVAAAIATYAAYKAGKWVLKKIGKAFKAGGNDYYFGRSDFRVSGGYQMCQHRIQPATSAAERGFGNMWLTETRRVDQVYFQCRQNEACCDLACCSYGGAGVSFPWWAILVVVLLICCCCCCCVFFIVYKFFRSLLDCILGSEDDDEVEAPKGSENYAMSQQAPYPSNGASPYPSNPPPY